MRKTEQSDLGGLWAIAWRSLAFLPYMLLVFTFASGLLLSRWALPIFAALFVYLEEWLHAGMAVLLWMLVRWIYRQFQVSRYFEAPPSML